MARMNLNFPYDEEIFNYKWKTAPDTMLTTMLSSGAVVRDSEIENLISNGSNIFTCPFYKGIDGEAGVYNGVNDIDTTEVSGDFYKGVVYGRQKGWNVKSFIKDFNSGADPMEQVVNGVANYWNKDRQTRLVKLLDGVFGITGNPAWALHTTSIVTGTSSVAEENKIGVTTINDAVVKACGDGANGFSLAIMHSVVANHLAGLQLLEFSKYTDKAGITRTLPIGTINGYTVVVNDNVTATPNAHAVSDKDYCTYVLGEGAIRYAPAPVEKPSEMDRDPAKFGGQDFIYTRLRECLHPYGFSFKGDATSDVGIPDSVLQNKSSWELKFDPKSIKMVKIVSNG